MSLLSCNQNLTFDDFCQIYLLINKHAHTQLTQSTAFLSQKRRAKLLQNDMKGYRQICGAMKSKQESIYNRVEEFVCKELGVEGSAYDSQYTAMMNNEV